MSYALPGQPSSPAPEPRTRPVTVTAAVWLLAVVAALFVLDFIVSLTTAGTITEVYREAYEGTDLEGTEIFAVVGSIGAAIVNLLLAAGFVALAVLDYKGINPARIVTWVVGAIALCCNGLGLLANGLMGAMQVDMEGVPDAAEVQRMVNDALPDWVMPLSYANITITIVALLAALILLALPASNVFFRKPAPPPPAPPQYPQAGV